MSRGRGVRGWLWVVGLVNALGGVAAAAERTPVAVLWMGDPASVAAGAQRTVDAVDAALARTQTARPIDSSEDRRMLVTGGPATAAQLLVQSAEAKFAKLKYAEAARDYEAAERILLEEVPFSLLVHALGDVERKLLACYDQLGRSADAARAAERLSWTPGSHEDVAPLLEKYQGSRAWAPSLPPVTVTSDPPGATVYRDLRAVGPAPQSVAGGDPAVDVLDVEAPGYRRAHRELTSGGAVEVKLIKEDRLGVLVDRVRAKAPDAPPSEVAAVGRRVGAARVLVLLPDGNDQLLARWLDVRKGTWAPETLRVDAAGAPAMEKLAYYAAPPEPAGPPTNALVAQENAPKPKAKRGPWGHWYTWAAAGAVVAVVAGLLIAQHVGSDSLTVTANH